MAEQARVFAERVDRLGAADDVAWVRQAYRLAYGRDAEKGEVALGVQFLKRAAALKTLGPAPPPLIWQYGYGRWDEKAGRLRTFQPLPHFQDDTWQGGPELPDPKLSWLMLNAAGGHPGEGLGQVVVRRWHAPSAGVVAIEGTLRHQLDEEDAEADGVRGKIVVGGRVVQTVVAFKSAAKTNVQGVRVQAGATIDFIVDCRSNLSNDSFTWPLTMTLTGSEERNFHSVEEFRGPPAPVQTLSARAKLAQVLLLANEFLFVD
jgi:hypothetical protein